MKNFYKMSSAKKWGVSGGFGAPNKKSEQRVTWPLNRVVKGNEDKRGLHDLQMFMLVTASIESSTRIRKY